MADEAADVANITVKFTSSDKSAGQISIPLESTIGELKEAIRSQFEVEPKRLIFQGRILNNNDHSLKECKLKDGLTVVVQASPVGTTLTPSPAAIPAPTAAAMATTPSMPVAQARVGGLGGGLATGRGGVVSPLTQPVAVVRMQPAVAARECLTTLTKVIDNIVTHPTEEKYRKIKRSNAGFRRKVGGVPGGEACMRALGFMEADADQGSWLLTPTAAAWDVLTVGRAVIQNALAALPSSSAGNPPIRSGTTGPDSSAGFAAGLGELPPPGAYPTTGGLGGLGGGGGGMGGMGGADMAMMQRMAQDPATMQAMMNDPSVQAMMRSNPRMAGAVQGMMANPGFMSQAMNAFQNNPVMVQQAQRMMQDPTALQRASEMGLEGAFAAGLNANQNIGQGFQQPSVGVGGLGGVPIAPSPVAPAPVAPAPAAVLPPPAAGGGNAPAREGSAESGVGGVGGEGQTEMTEDEILAEAIRRSMEES